MGVALGPRFFPIGSSYLQCDFQEVHSYDEPEENSTAAQENLHGEDNMDAAMKRMRAARTRLGFGERNVDNCKIKWRMDECMYVNRRICEEVEEMLESVEGLESVIDEVGFVGAMFEGFQQRQRAVVEGLVRRYLPSGWRGKLFTAGRDRGERKCKEAVEKLVDDGGGIKEKYELIWRHQWERRMTLEQVGSATGIWRLVISYVGGVPPVLLDYARDMNSKDGPTAALRKTHGPKLYDITQFAFELRALVAAIRDSEESLGDIEVYETLNESAIEYKSVVERFLTILQAALASSPLYIEPSPLQETGNAASKRNPASVGTADDF